MSRSINRLLSPLQWGGVLLACLTTLIVALVMPVRLPERDVGMEPSNILPEDMAEVAPEELSAFLASERWGVPINESEEVGDTPVKQDAPLLNPVLVEMGYVGLVAVKDQRMVLLALPEGNVVRLSPGDTLPDGRTLVSVTDNRLILKGNDMAEEVLTLFPRIQPDHPAPGTSGPGGGEGSAEDPDRLGATKVPESR